NADDACRQAIPDTLALWTRTDVDGVLETARNRSIVFRRDEEDGLRRANRIAKLCPRLRWPVIKLFIVERQIADRNEIAIELRRRPRHQDLGDLQTERSGAQTADNHRN